MSLLSFSVEDPLQGSPWWRRTLALRSCVLRVLAVLLCVLLVYTSSSTEVFYAVRSTVPHVLVQAQYVYRQALPRTLHGRQLVSAMP